MEWEPREEAESVDYFRARRDALTTRVDEELRRSAYFSARRDALAAGMGGEVSYANGAAAACAVGQRAQGGGAASSDRSTTALGP